MAIGAFGPSLLEWVGSSKAVALRIMQSPPPGYLSPVAMRARVRSEYPVLPLHGDTFLLGMWFMFLVNITWDVPACSECDTNNMKKRAIVHVHIFMGGYIC